MSFVVIEAAAVTFFSSAELRTVTVTALILLSDYIPWYVYSQ